MLVTRDNCSNRRKCSFVCLFCQPKIVDQKRLDHFTLPPSPTSRRPGLSRALWILMRWRMVLVPMGPKHWCRWCPWCRQWCNYDSPWCQWMLPVLPKGSGSEILNRSQPYVGSALMHQDHYHLIYTFDSGKTRWRMGNLWGTTIHRTFHPCHQIQMDKTPSSRKELY